MLNKIALFFSVFVIFSFPMFAQKGELKGIITDSAVAIPLPFTAVALQTLPDSVTVTTTFSDSAGRFSFPNIPFGDYILRTSFFGYKDYLKKITVNQEVQSVNIYLSPEVQTLKVIEFTVRRPPVEQKGDTTVFNASSFKTLPGSDAENLINKMPGITTENGQLKAQGEEVRQILVDGKPFFGDDPAIALKNLPADAIDKVEVFDKQSEQAQFTGFDDGNRQKTINIVTKKDRREGLFGKAYAGYGTNERYQSGGNVNIFKGNRRISVIGMANNINQQNFSAEDLSGISGNSRRGGGGGGRSGWGRNSGENFLVGNRNGISTTNSIGFNYSDSLGKKTGITGSYFFNRTNSLNNRVVNRNYFLQRDSSQVYNEISNEENLNFSHRLNLRLEHTFDSSNSILFTPRINFQRSYLNSDLAASTFSPLSNFSNTYNIYESNSDALDYNAGLLFRHKFKKNGRTFSLNLNGSGNIFNGESNLTAVNEYSSREGLSRDSIRQVTNTLTNSWTTSANFVYTEPISDKSQFLVNYFTSYSNSDFDKETYRLNEQYGVRQPDSSLSGENETFYLTNRGGVGYRLRTEKLIFNIGADLQNVQLDNQALGISSGAVETERSFNAVLPNAFLRYNISENKNLRVYFRSGTDLPSVTQLQNIVDNSNPLLIRKGNSDLGQSYSNTLIFRYSVSDADKLRSFSVFSMLRNAFSYIGNAVYIPVSDSLLADGFLLREGVQLSQPENLNGYWNYRGNFNYSLPITKLKVNLGINTGYSFVRTPGRINYINNFTRTHNISQGFSISSNFKKNLDFTFSYSANYNIVNSLLQPQVNNNYFVQTVEFKSEYIFWKGFLIQTNIGQYVYRGLSSGFNQDYLLWNLGFGKKILKDQKGELRLSVFDVLNANRSVNRVVTETYVEDVQNSILNRYFMLTFTYNFSKFGKPGSKEPVR